MKSNGTPLTPGIRVLCRSAEWLVTRVEPVVEDHFAVHCVGSDDLVRGHERIFLTQLDSVDPVDPRNTQLVEDKSSGYRLSKLFLEAQLRQMPATGIEPDLAGMGAFKPMKFQEETVQRALLQLRPRLLLADAVGLGKTIQVGMVLTELLRRGRANRILVLAKKSMLTQFQAELWNRFALPLVRLDSEGIARLRLRIPANKNPFEVYHRVIISIDTLKNVARYEHFLKDTRWDVVVIDEAHNVAGASVPERHLSNRLARLLSRQSDSLLLTTATPHNGKRETFGRLISLCDPSAVPDPGFKEYSANDIRNFFLMRFKEDIRSEAGDMLSERIVEPLSKTTTDATPQEEKAYKALAELRKSLSAGPDKDDPHKLWQKQGLLQYGLYKLFLSSPEACQETVRNRLEHIRKKEPDSPEILCLENLEQSLEGLELAKSSRYRLLKKQLQEIGWDGSSRSPRILIFTEYRRTLDALAAALAKDFKIKYSPKFEDQPRQLIATIHGSFPDVHLMKTVEAFATGSSPVRALLATDVASEGINLHHECHHIIHYDLPWSIITLIQRNGRIDRLGQKKSPNLRYLMVNSAQGFLAGDKEIFQRLIDKVEVINKLRQSGESVLQLYDPQAEEQYIASNGILKGNVNVLEKPAADVSPETEALQFMLLEAGMAGEDEHQESLPGSLHSQRARAGEPAALKPSRLRFYSDRQFLLDGYRYLGEQNSDYIPIQEQGHLMILNAPKDLKRRLGASDDAGGVIFGATAIPDEAWPQNGQFRLTEDPEKVELAIQAARHTEGYWSQDQLCSEQHPILQWIAERLLMNVKRGESPLILSRHLQPGELCFCFIGQVSSKVGTPLVVDAHAISFLKGGGFQQRDLREALKAARFDQLVNAGQKPNIAAAQTLIPAAVESSLKHMNLLKKEHEQRMMPLLRKEDRRLHDWWEKRGKLLKRSIAELGDDHPVSRRRQRELKEIESYIKDRQKNWKDTHFIATFKPSTRLIIVIEGF